MINLTLFAAVLLALRLVSVAFLILVLHQQWQAIRLNRNRPLNATRRMVFVLVLITFLGNAIPILIDTAALTGHYTRRQPPLLGITYAFSNALTSAVSAVGWWYFYKLVKREYITLQPDSKG